MSTALDNLDDSRNMVASCGLPIRPPVRGRRIAVVSSYTPSLTNFRFELLKRMVEAGHTVTAYGPEDDEIVRAGLHRIGVELKVVPMARAGLNPLEDLRTLSFLFREFQSLKFDTVIPYTMKPIIYAGIAARMAGIRHRCFLVTGLGHVFSADGAASQRTALSRCVFGSACGVRLQRCR